MEVDWYPCAITQSRLQDEEATYSPWFIIDRVRFYLKLCEGPERNSKGEHPAADRPREANSRVTAVS